MTRGNEASVHTAAAIGMKKTGEFTDAHYGEMYVYALTREDYRSHG